MDRGRAGRPTCPNLAQDGEKRTTERISMYFLRSNFIRCLEEIDKGEYISNDGSYMTALR